VGIAVILDAEKYGKDYGNESDDWQYAPDELRLERLSTHRRDRSVARMAGFGATAHIRF
jgi:hypothetical protein